MMMRDLAPRYKVEAAFVYELLDEPYWDPSYEAHMGLVTLKRDSDQHWTLGVCKLACQTVRHVGALGAE